MKDAHIDTRKGWQIVFGIYVKNCPACFNLQGKQIVFGIIKPISHTEGSIFAFKGFLIRFSNPIHFSL